MPFLTLVIGADRRVQIVSVEDIARTVALSLTPGAPARVTWELAHPDVLTLADLRLALVQPPTVRDEAWARHLFLIPYSIPLRRDVARMEGDTHA